MARKPSAFNSDVFVHGSRTWPVFDEAYSKFTLTEKRLDSDDVACFPVSVLRKRCPSLLPRPQPRPVIGCPANYGPVARYPQGVDVRVAGQRAAIGPRYSIDGGFANDDKEIFWG